MTAFKRIFGSGPLFVSACLVLLFIAWYLKDLIHTPQIVNDHQIIRLSVFALLTILTAAIGIWSFISLRPESRGRTLITTGAFKYFRHPLYAAFITFFSFGLAVFLNNWIFIIWAALLQPIGHLMVAGEEKMLKSIFPGDYEKYCNQTGRFFPRLFTIKSLK